MSNSSALSTFVSQLLRTALAAVFVILCSRWMGPEGRGELGLVLFWAGFLMMGNDFVGGSNLANALQRFSLSALFPFSVAWSIFVLITGFVLLMIFGSGSKMAWMVGFVSMPMVLLNIQYNIQQGLAMVTQRNRLQLMLEFLKILFLCAFVYNWDKMDLGVGTAIASLFYSYLIVLAVSSWLLKKEIVDAIKSAQKPPGVLFTDGFWSQNGHLAQFLAYRLSLYSLTYILGNHTAAGIYANALLIADAIWIFANSFGTIAHVRILRSKNENFKADITLRYAVFAVFGTVAACLLLSVLPSSIFVWVFGIGFETLKDTTLLLIPAILAVAASSLFSHYLHAVNRFKALFVANLAGLLLQTAIAFWLIPKWGIYGACVAADTGFILTLVIVYLFFINQNPHARLKGPLRFKLILKIAVRMLKRRSARL
ncbi:MAG: polysaccharide biosynthesis C-terminal domain-containing protein [Sphingomonadales bacterium]